MNFPPGTQVYIGAPANPLPVELSDAIGRTLGKFSGILEAHLPLMYVEGKIDPPAQILVVVLEENAPRQSPRIMEALSRILPADFPLDVFELQANHEMLPAVRKAECKLNLLGRVN